MCSSESSAVDSFRPGPPMVRGWRARALQLDAYDFLGARVCAASALTGRLRAAAARAGGAARGAAALDDAERARGAVVRVRGTAWRPGLAGVAGASSSGTRFDARVPPV